MANDAVRLSNAFLTRVAERVSRLMLDTSDLHLRLDGYTPSEKFTSAMKDILKKSGKRKISKPLKTIFIAAAILALILGCAFGAVAIRKARINYEFYDKSRFAMIDWDYESVSNGVAMEELDKIETYYEPAYIPEGFIVTERNPYNTIHRIGYSKLDGQSRDYCVFSQKLPGSRGLIDIEDDDIYYLEIKGYPAFCVVDHFNKSVRLFWCDDYYVYYIIFESPDITMEKVIKMAESLAPVE